jgi:hypothetical protein
VRGTHHHIVTTIGNEAVGPRGICQDGFQHSDVTLQALGAIAGDDDQLIAHSFELFLPVQ